jgi:hypothetical protein
MNIYLELSVTDNKIYNDNFIDTARYHSLVNDIIYCSYNVIKQSYLDYKYLFNVQILKGEFIEHKNIFILYKNFDDLKLLKNTFFNCKIFIMRQITSNKEMKMINSFFSNNKVDFVFENLNKINDEYFKFGIFNDKCTDINYNISYSIDEESYLNLKKKNQINSFLLKEAISSANLNIIKLENKNITNFILDFFKYSNSLKESLTKIQQSILHYSNCKQNIFSIFSKNLKNFKKIKKYK